MKQCKTLLSVVLAILMLVTMIVPTLATQEGTETGGSITIDNAVVGQTYNAYQLLYLESYNATSGAYAFSQSPEFDRWRACDLHGRGRQRVRLQRELY